MSIEEKIKMINDKIRINQIKSKVITKNPNKNTFNISQIKEKYLPNSKISFLSSPYIINNNSTQIVNPHQTIQTILSKYKSNSDILIISQEITKKARLQLNNIMNLNKNMLIESTEVQFPSEKKKKTLYSLEHQNDFVYAVNPQNDLRESVKENNSTHHHFIENLLTTHEDYAIIQTETEKRRRVTEYLDFPSSNSVVNKKNGKRLITSMNLVESFDGVYPIRRRIAYMQKEKKVITDRLSPPNKKTNVEKDEIFNYIKEYVNQNSIKRTPMLFKKPPEIKVPILIQRSTFIKHS